MSNPNAELLSDSDAYSIGVVGRHVEVTETMKQYAIEKIHKMDRISSRIIDVTITMDIQKLDHKVAIVMSVGNVRVKVAATTEDMYASIDLATDRLVSKLRKYKERIQEHHGKALHSVDMDVHVFRSEPEEVEINDAIDEANQVELERQFSPHKIVRTSTLPLKTLTYSEAAMRMDLSDASFKVFRSEEDQKLKIIHRLDDGDYAVVEVE